MGTEIKTWIECKRESGLGVFEMNNPKPNKSVYFGYRNGEVRRFPNQQIAMNKGYYLGEPGINPDYEEEIMEWNRTNQALNARAEEIWICSIQEHLLRKEIGYSGTEVIHEMINRIRGLSSSTISYDSVANRLLDEVRYLKRIANFCKKNDTEKE